MSWNIFWTVLIMTHIISFAVCCDNLPLVLLNGLTMGVVLGCLIEDD